MVYSDYIHTKNGVILISVSAGFGVFISCSQSADRQHLYCNIAPGKSKKWIEKEGSKEAHTLANNRPVPKETTDPLPV